MFCTKCGHKQDEVGAFCCECGAEMPADLQDAVPDTADETADEYEALLDKEDFIRHHVDAPLLCRIISNISFWGTAVTWLFILIKFLMSISQLFVAGPTATIIFGWMFPNESYNTWVSIFFYTAFSLIYILPYISTLKKSYTEYSLSSAVFASCWGVIPFVGYPLLFDGLDMLPWLFLAEFFMLLHTLMQYALHRAYMLYLDRFDDVIEEYEPLDEDE